MSGPIEVSGEKYNAPMPPHNFLPDQDIAEILTFVKNEFGDGGELVKAIDISVIRKELSL